MSRRDIGAFIRQCCRVDGPLPGHQPLGRPPVSQDELLADTAIYQGVAPLVQAALRADRRDDRPIPALDDWVMLATGAALRAYTDLALAATTIDGLGHPWAVLKGAALANTVYPDPLQRLFADVDVLVRPADLKEATDALVETGGRILDKNWSLMASDRRGQVHLRLPSGTLVDLHWSLLNSGQVRDRFTLPTDDLLTRLAKTTTPTGTVVPILGDVDQLAHVALHAALSGGHRLSWFVDVDRMVRDGFTDWEELVARATTWRGRAAIGGVLLRGQRVLSTPIPTAVIDELSNRRTSLLVSVLDRCAPTGTARHDPGSALVMSSLRDTGSTASIPRLNRWLNPKGAARAWRSWRSKQPTLDLMSTRAGTPDDYFRVVRPGGS
ncbi:MAG: nucleotidyltransferase family protein [Actinomycetia bacterium]|nr:nucleotidyltransferase family protein [Actinomycetes bacterium]